MAASATLRADAAREGFTRMPSKETQYTKERIERAARIYSTTSGAAAALGIKPGSFSRLCRKYEIATPIQQKQNRRGSSTG
jgi:hypothetical protein